MILASKLGSNKMYSLYRLSILAVARKHPQSLRTLSIYDEYLISITSVDFELKAIVSYCETMSIMFSPPDFSARREAVLSSKLPLVVNF